MPANRKSRQASSGERDRDNGQRSRDLDLKRARGELACIECTRLKLKCDKKVPCSSCIRRHKAAMCPNGHAWTDESTQSLLANTAQLHRKLSEMSQRIRQLEDALEISHSANSATPHPLLRSELLEIKRGVDADAASDEDGVEVNKWDNDYVEAMGSMNISEQGVPRLIGRSGGTDQELDGSSVQQSDPDFPSKTLFPHNTLPLSPDSCLFTPHRGGTRTDVLKLIAKQMPSFERASSLCETWLENFSFILRVVQRDQIFSELLPGFYKRNHTSTSNGSSASPGSDNSSSDEDSSPFGTLTPHEVALLLIVFACGALVDLTLPPYNAEADKYYQMSLAALSASRVVGSVTLAAVQAVSLMAGYSAHCGGNNTLAMADSLFSLAANLAVSIGLHRDGERWGISKHIVERRRIVFWELFVCDAWHNVSNGKPPSLVLKYADTKFPDGTSDHTDDEGNIEKSYWRFRYEFERDLVYPIHDLCASTKPVRLAQVMEFDRKITQMYIPKHLTIPHEVMSMEADGVLRIMQRMFGQTGRNKLIMFVHRGFFAKALVYYPHDPLSSPYAQSYLATYQAALSMLKTTREYYDLVPDLLSRFWGFWSHAFSAAVIIGSIVVKSRDSSMAYAALIELNLAVDLFERASQKHVERAKRALPTLLRLREKAYSAARLHNSKIPPTPTGASDTPEEDVLAVLSGNSRGRELIGNELNVWIEHTGPTTVPVADASSTSQPKGRVGSSGSSSLLTSSSEVSSTSVPMDYTNVTAPNTFTMDTTIPSNWSESFNETQLMNYLLSDIDPSIAQNMTDPIPLDPAAYLWTDMLGTWVTSQPSGDANHPHLGTMPRPPPPEQQSIASDADVLASLLGPNVEAASAFPQSMPAQQNATRPSVQMADISTWDESLGWQNAQMFF